MDPNEAFARLSPAERAEVILNLEELILRDIEDAESAELRSLYPERKTGSAFGRACEILFRGSVNTLYLLANFVSVGLALQILSEYSVPPGLVDYVLWIGLPIMLIAWFFHGIISLLGALGYKSARTKYGMIKLASRVATLVAIVGTVVLSVVLLINRVLGRHRDR